MTEIENKWNFDDDSERCSAIQSEAEYRAEEAKAIAEGKAREAEAAPNAEAKAAVAEADSKARIAEADADARAREAEATYGWLDGARRFVQTCIIGGALFASFYFTPDFWPSITRTLSEVLREIAHRPS